MTKKPKYKVVLNVLGNKWVSEGNTILKALQSLKPRYDEIKGKGMLKVYVNGKNKLDKLMTMPTIRKILVNKVIKAHWARNIDFLIKGE